MFACFVLFSLWKSGSSRAPWVGALPGSHQRSQVSVRGLDVLAQQHQQYSEGSEDAGSKILAPQTDDFFEVAEEAKELVGG